MVASPIAGAVSSGAELQALDSAAVAGCRAVHLVAVGIVPAVPIAGALSSGADAGRVGGVAGNSAHFPDVGAGGVGARAGELPDVAPVPAGRRSCPTWPPCAVSIVPAAR